MKTLLTLLILSTTLVASDAMAQDDYEDLDGPGRSGKKKKKKAKKAKKSRKADVESEIIREIERGYYAKASVGAAGYLLDMSRYMRTGTALNISFGQDFVDTETSSMAWELSIYQGVHNGMHYEQQGSELSGGVMTPSQLVQGDSRTIGLLANYEYSAYPLRRLGVGLRAGAGIIVVPLLMYSEAYNTKVVASEWRQNVSTIHQGVKPIVFAGPTIEYYTKLSHFSVGLDIDVGYTIGIDLGFVGTGYMKYTF